MPLRHISRGGVRRGSFTTGITARILVVMGALFLGTLLPVTASAHREGRQSGCHAWAPIFRPILSSLAAGQIEVALPTYLPPLGPHVYVHVNIDDPPKTYQVTLTTSRSERIARTSVLIVIHGNAGNHLPRLHPRPSARANGKPLYLRMDAYGFAGFSWYYRGGGITYTVAAPAFVPLSTVIRIAGSVLPAPLRRTPITSGTGGSPSACR